MLTGHASHQIGLDADIWLDADAATAACRRRERENSERRVDDPEGRPDRRRAAAGRRPI